MRPAAARAAHGSANKRATKRPVPRRSGRTYSAGTLKFLKLQTGRADMVKAAVPTRIGPQNNGWWVTIANESRPRDCDSRPRKIGNSARPAPAGAGTPVKKL